MTETGWPMVFKIQCMPCGRLALIQLLDAKVPYNVTRMNGTRFGTAENTLLSLRSKRLEKSMYKRINAAWSSIHGFIYLCAMIGCLQTVTGVAKHRNVSFFVVTTIRMIYLPLGELLVDGHELDLGVLINVLPGVRVVATVPDNLRTSSKAGQVPTGQTTGYRFFLV